MGAIRTLIRQRRARLLILTLGAAVFAGAVAFALAYSSGLGRELEGKLIDWRFEQRGPRAAPDDIVILGIDDESDTRLGQRFPYDRDTYAAALAALERGGARAVVFDIQLLAPDNARDPRARRADRTLLEALHQTTPHLPVVVATDRTTGSGFDYVAMPFEGFATGNATIDTDPFGFSGVTTGLASFGYTAADAVHRVVEPRRMVPTAAGEQVMPSLSLAGLAAAEGRSADDYRDLPRELSINYYGGDGHFERLPFWWAASGDARITGRSGAASLVEDRIVLVGATSAALQDFHEVPFDADSERADRTQQMAGVEIHANALANMRDGNWLRPTGAPLAAVAAIGLAVGVWAMLMLVTPILGAPAAVGLITGYGWFAQRQFDDGVVHALFAPLASGTLSFIVVTAMLAVTSARERSRVRSLFARYVSPEVVRRLVETQETIELGGARREITVLFSDIRGFTTLSENIDPVIMVEQLNSYFAEMVEVVEHHDGMLDKFIGDGLMAVFGAPLEQPDHAKRACAAAVEMLERLTAINDARVAQGLPRLAMGIGIHTGEAVVGNVGSPRRRVDFTAIGDTVNLAARLEGATKKLGIPVVVSQTTAAQAVPLHDFRQFGSLVVRGRTQATEVFELVLPAALSGRLASAVDSAAQPLGMPAAGADGSGDRPGDDDWLGAA